jgi:hypothetical protein
MPVLAITGMQETALLGTGYQQEVNLDKLFTDVAEYDQMIYNPAQLPSVVDNAIRTAYARRGVAHLTVPNDIQIAGADADPFQHVAPARPPATAPVMLQAPGRPGDDDLQRVAALLNEGGKIAILAGAGALHARDELLAVAEALGAPIVKTLSGKAAVPDDSPYTTGGIGLLGTRPSEELMEQIDTLFMVGTNFPYTKHLPAPGKVRVAQIEADPARAGGRVATEVPVVGDAKLALQGLLPLLKPRTDTSFLQGCQAHMDKWRRNMAAQADAARDPIAPQYVVSVLDELAGTGPAAQAGRRHRRPPRVAALRQGAFHPLVRAPRRAPDRAAGHLVARHLHQQFPSRRGPGRRFRSGKCGIHRRGADPDPVLRADLDIDRAARRGRPGSEAHHRRAAARPAGRAARGRARAQLRGGVPLRCGRAPRVR